MDPSVLLASDLYGVPLPIVIAIAVLAVGLLFIRFILKTAFTLVKVGILVAIGVVVWLGVSFLLDQV